ncbi:hypothetical protein F6X40_09675 [Paraburkholderia sp. UCT31]|uniref:hypothetical protein n=1 Tax=Paraburkholderia sp. UCT31 TaxID=2615209 RepID=UPI001655BD3A|nr:hypothetical protein [Paraburkholderia sp. UCT31]MBC8737077.1 hypothetical protein [Paraburkholderia sp. UCT31]
MTISYLACLKESVGNSEFVAQFNRLTGLKLGESAMRSPLERCIDEATGHDDAVAAREDFAFRQFALFVKDIWERLPPDERATRCWVPAGSFSFVAGQLHP